MSNLPHVFVVEDDPSTRRLLQKELGANGFEVTLAIDGLDALVKLESLQPDVILCDLAMPNLDGLSFVRAIKEKDPTRKIPVIFLTANSDPRAMIDSINIGARFYLTKPFAMKELVWKLKRVLRDGSQLERAHSDS